ncbi:MAG: hypothetical protein SGJ19_15995 [Planctomycetia bacterium]|nr:hypothetical protein [Planctomycetia bacterium]
MTSSTAAEPVQPSGAVPDAPSVPPVKETTRRRVIRLGGYTAWTVAALAMPLVLDRLIACPILRQRLGAVPFGSFIWVRSLAYMFGNIVANGFSIPFLRDLVKQTDEEVRIRMRTALLLTSVMTCAVMCCVSVVACYFGKPFVWRHAEALFLPFIGFAIARSLDLVITVRLRVQRRVRQIFILRTVEGVILSAAAIFFPTRDILLIALIYFSSTLIPMLMTGFFNRDVLAGGRGWDWGCAKELLKQAPAGSLMVAIDSAQVYLPIILLGAMAGQNAVPAFYAAGVGYAFLTPITHLGQAVLSLISGKKTFDLHGRRGRIYLATTLGLALAVGLTSYIVGRWLAEYLYPLDAPETLKFYHWMAIANGCASVRALMRPIGLKFAPLKSVVRLSWITLAAQVVALVALIPFWQAAGAAVALAISSAVGMVIWMVIFEQFRSGAASAAEIASEGIASDTE